MTPIPSTLRERVIARAHNRCEYCQLEQRSQVATFPVDHVLPRSRGGRSNLANLALACPRCNALKWIHVEATDPLEGATVSLFNPRTDEWHAHFRWSSGDPTIIEAMTPIGRATVELLQLNASSRIDIRRWLAQLGRHPPA